jgi:hypothetical protein
VTAVAEGRDAAMDIHAALTGAQSVEMAERAGVVAIRDGGGLASVAG